MTKEDKIAQITAKIESLEAVMPKYTELNRHPVKVEQRKQELANLKKKLAELTGEKDA